MAWRRRWREVVGWGLAALFAALGIEIFSALCYLSALHGSLGVGVWPAVCTLWALVGVLLLAPAGALLGWGRRAPLPRRPLQLIALCASACLGLSMLVSHWLGAEQAVALSGESLASLDLAPRLQRLASLRVPPARGPKRGLAVPDPVECDLVPSADRVSLLVTHRDRSEPWRTVSACVQAATLERALFGLEERLSARASRGPVKLDAIVGLQTLGWRHAWLAAFKLRPGRDGACFGRRCLMPWQLLAQGSFSTYRPLSFIPDFQFGIDPERLARALGASDADSARVRRVTTSSYAFELGGRRQRITPLRRMRPARLSVSEPTVRRAVELSKRHLIRAQLDDGRFRYTLDPFTGARDERGFNLARQAGAVLVLCELGGRSRPVARAAERGLAALGRHERRSGDLGALTRDDRAPVARLGESALPLVSLLACDHLTAGRFDELTGRLARYVLALQREDGGFRPSLRLDDARALPGPEPCPVPSRSMPPGRRCWRCSCWSVGRARGRAPCCPRSSGLATPRSGRCGTTPASTFATRCATFSFWKRTGTAWPPAPRCSATATAATRTFAGTTCVSRRV